MKRIDNIYRLCSAWILSGLAGLLFLSAGCRTTTAGTISASSAEGLGVSWGVTVAKQMPGDALSFEELIEGADVIVRAKVVSSRPVSFKFKTTTYYQLTLLRIEEVIKGGGLSEVITVYARENNRPAISMSAYEFCDDVLVFLKRNNGHYFTYNGAYGQFSIAGGRITNWRRIKDGCYEDSLITTYTAAKQLIISNLYIIDLNQRMRRQSHE